MKTLHALGHNSNWNIDSFNEQDIGDGFLITAYSNGIKFLEKKKMQDILPLSLIDLQYYGKKLSGQISGGKLKEFSFHPANLTSDDHTSVAFLNSIIQGIQFQSNEGFDNIIIPNCYADDDINELIGLIQEVNDYVSKKRKSNKKYYMTLAFSRDLIIDSDKVEQILTACTDMSINFDGYFIVCESSFGFGEKVNKDVKVIRNLATVFKTLKEQQFETIYGYANWDSILYLAITDIDFISIGTYENLRKFDINRFVLDESGGGSKGYYFSTKLLNMIKADDVTILREFGFIDRIKNERNIFSDIILKENYQWNIHKPDVNKNYLLSIDNLLHEISGIPIEERKQFVLDLIDQAINNYAYLEENDVYLTSTSGNYHLGIWKTILSRL